MNEKEKLFKDNTVQKIYIVLEILAVNQDRIEKLWQIVSVVLALANQKNKIQADAACLQGLDQNCQQFVLKMNALGQKKQKRGLVQSFCGFVLAELCIE